MPTRGRGAGGGRPERLRYVAAGLHPLSDHSGPPLRVLVVDGDRISWVGAEPAEAPPSDRTVDLGGGWITPAFVDAHVHATATGLAAAGVDLHDAGSAAEAMDRVRRHAAGLPPGAAVLGSRWDDTGWPEGRPPTAAEVAQAAPGRTVLLNRVEGHSCVVDPRTLAALPLTELEGVDRGPDGTPTGYLAERAGEAARVRVVGALPAAQIDTARRTTCARAAALGIASLHEMSHPGTSGLDDALAWAAGSWDVEVLTWWADIDPGPGFPDALRPGGDLFLDGAIGSHTAAVSAGYRDAPQAGSGQLFHTDAEVAHFFVEWTRRGRGAGVHAIGDLAIEQAVAGLERAAEIHGVDAVRRCRHRVEHVELPRPDHLPRLARLGVVASVQPVFDELWGGPDRLYARRFGAQVSLASNPFGRMAEEGLRLAFGSDTTVTPLDPWGAVAAAERHRGGSVLDRRAAFAAHTLGGRHVAGQDDVGPLAVGARADLAVWDRDPFAVPDPRAVRCLATLVAGRSAVSELNNE